MEITVNVFDKKSIKKAIKELEDYKKRLVEKQNELVKALAEHGVEVAKSTIIGLPYSTGDLELSIFAVYNSKTNSAIIKADNEHAVFVEFGTGIGKDSYPNPDLINEIGWDYFTGGEKGWQFTTKDGRDGWIIYANNNEYYFTEGQQAKHFMDNAVNSIIEQYPQMAKKVFIVY